MSQYKLVGCAPEDSAGIAKCKVSAFWSEDWWTVVFSDKRPGALSSAMTARIPHGLVQGRRLQRHQKVVHVPTGEIVGYARWILAEEAANEWLDAQVCDVSDEEKAKHKKAFDETVWEFDDTNPQSDDHIHVWQQELSPKAPHLGTCNIYCKCYTCLLWNHKISHFKGFTDANSYSTRLSLLSTGPPTQRCGQHAPSVRNQGS